MLLFEKKTVEGRFSLRNSKYYLVIVCIIYIIYNCIVIVQNCMYYILNSVKISLPMGVFPHWVEGHK